MDAGEAVAVAAEFITRAGVDYPVHGLVADRFESGWSVYAPVHVDDSDPMAFLDIPVGRAVFLVGDTGRVEQVSSSAPPRQVRQRFTEDERMRARVVPPSVAILSAHLDGEPPRDPGTRRDEQLARHASTMLDPVAQQLALLAPAGWRQVHAVFALTVRAASASCEVATDAGWTQVPRPIVDAVRAQREVSAAMSAGPWWRLSLTVSAQGELGIGYDYGDQPFPPDQLQPAQNYRDDTIEYPRPSVPMWLAGYLAGPRRRGRRGTAPRRHHRRTPGRVHRGGPESVPEWRGTNPMHAVAQRFTYLPAIARCSRVGGGIRRRCWSRPTRGSARCPRSTPALWPGSTTRC